VLSFDANNKRRMSHAAGKKALYFYPDIKYLHKLDCHNSMWQKVCQYGTRENTNKTFPRAIITLANQMHLLPICYQMDAFAKMYFSRAGSLT
jgi:hypothetical protein